MRLLSGNLCMICGKELDRSFQGDHIVPFSAGGPTTINNGQALCRECNLVKGKKHE